jgi:hypothetical protein
VPGGTYGAHSVKRACFTYDIKDFTSKMQKLGKLKKKKTLIDNYRKAYQKMQEKRGVNLRDSDLKVVYPPATGLCCCFCKSIKLLL